MTASQFEWTPGLPLGLEWCESCGEARGVAWHDGEFLESVCICDGPLCRVCGVNRIRRPVSDHWCTTREEFIHVPWFCGQIPCDECRSTVGENIL